MFDGCLVVGGFFWVVGVWWWVFGGDEFLVVVGVWWWCVFGWWWAFGGGGCLDGRCLGNECLGGGCVCVVREAVEDYGFLCYGCWRWWCCMVRVLGFGKRWCGC